MVEEGEFELDGDAHNEMDLDEVMEYSEDLKDTAEEQKIVEKHKMKTEELAMKQPNKKEEEASNSPVTNGNNV